ncbi:MAG: SDR family oxidoreductase [Deltaproteobacteria bacterium]|nr:SDR family oxidoreductase [Deltaproteobacteria bacterium]
MKKPQVPDLNNKIVLITGATNGIGKQTAEAIAPSGATLVIVGRNPEKTAQLTAELQSMPGAGKIHSLIADLSSQADIRKLAEEFKSSFSRLDILINNAGALFTSHETTVDGYERTWALNHLNYFLLTTLLKDLLLASAPARIVNVSSDAHKPAKMLWNDLQFNQATFASGWPAYCQSKLANILFTKELSRKLAGTGVITNCLHPGFVNTGFAKNNGKLAKAAMLISRPFQRNALKGAETVIWAATSIDAGKLSGEYLYDCKVRKPTRTARDVADAKRLWSLSEEMTTTQGAWATA